MITPELSVSPSADRLSCKLRVDQIRRDTLIQLAQAWADGGRTDIEEALDHLAEVLQSPRGKEGELDAAVEAVDDAACMEYPRIHLTRQQARQLRRELATVLTAWPRSRPLSDAPTVPQQRGQAGAA